MGLACAAGCGDDTDGSGGAAASSSSTTSSGHASSTSVGATTGVSSSSTSSAGGAGVADPNLDGVHTVEPFDGSVTAPGTNDQFAVHGFRPSDDTGPLSLVVVIPEQLVAGTQYDGYAHRLATFGSVAVIADYPVDGMPNHVRNATDIEATIDWAEAEAPFAAQVDSSHTGVLGHGLGGKVALLVGQADSRVIAVLGLDAVDSIPAGCMPQYCPDMSQAVSSITVPLGFLDETLDASTTCAASAEASSTLYEHAPSPTFLATFVGGSHTSFLDSPGSCGAPCTPCASPTLDQAVALDAARAYAAAYFETTLHGDAAYQTYLTGAEAEARYVTPGILSLSTK